MTTQQIGSERDDHREFLLSALRTASLRCKAMENEINTIGIALKADLIGPETAVAWIEDARLMFLVAPLPLGFEIENQKSKPHSDVSRETLDTGNAVLSASSSPNSEHP